MKANSIAQGSKGTFPSGSQPRVLCSFGNPTLNEMSPLLPEIEGLMKSKTSASLVSAVSEQTKGQSSPLGAMLSGDGTNFSVYSEHAKPIELLLFDCVDDAQLKRAISIDPATNRTYHYWHIFVFGVKAGQIYGYRVDASSRALSSCF